MNWFSLYQEEFDFLLNDMKRSNSGKSRKRLLSIYKILTKRIKIYLLILLLCLIITSLTGKPAPKPTVPAPAPAAPRPAPRPTPPPSNKKDSVELVIKRQKGL